MTPLEAILACTTVWFAFSAIMGWRRADHWSEWGRSWKWTLTVALVAWPRTIRLGQMQRRNR